MRFANMSNRGVSGFKKFRREGNLKNNFSHEKAGGSFAILGCVLGRVNYKGAYDSARIYSKMAY